MSLQKSIEDGFVKRIPVDMFQARSLIKASNDAIETALKIPLTENTSKTILRELYEGLRQYCEALGFFQGYKFLSHEVITVFLDERLNEKLIATYFDRYRKIRNGINYYGKDISLETVKDALNEIPKIILKLKKHEQIMH